MYVRWMPRSKKETRASWNILQLAKKYGAYSKVSGAGAGRLVGAISDLGRTFGGFILVIHWLYDWKDTNRGSLFH
jgi:hypothetical protein